MRDSPSNSGNVINELPLDSSIEVIKQKGAWFYVAASCAKGWMHGNTISYDKAQAESFFSWFKAELVENSIFATVEDTRSEVFGYIEGYYNRIRLHSGLGYQSPLKFEK